MCHALALTLFFAAAGGDTPPGESVAADIRVVAGQGAGSPAGRAAWERLSRADAAALPDLLRAMDTPDVVAANWLRTAFERVLDRATAGGAGGVDVAPLLAFARDPARQGRARRFALEVVEGLQPGTTADLLPGWLDDPEFRYDAVADLLAKAKGLGDSAAATEAYRRAFDHARDQDQAQKAAAGLLDRGVQASVARHLGYLTDWHVIGPFDAGGKKGFTTVYPPEKAVDLFATLAGKDGPVRWKRYRAAEPSPKTGAKHVALVNLRDANALGDADDAVAFAYTEFTVPEARAVEFRGAADDNFTVWLNGERAFGFEEYSNGVRFDRHRFPARLQAGKNTVLVKVCQSPPYLAPNWEFFLRVCDVTGRGVPFENALPEPAPTGGPRP